MAILFGSAAAGWILRPSFVIAAVRSNVASLTIHVVGPKARVVHISIGQKISTETSVDVYAVNASDLKVTVEGPVWGTLTKTELPRLDCLAEAMPCRFAPGKTSSGLVRLTDIDAYEVQPAYEVVGSPDGQGRGAMVASIGIPPWLQFGYPVDEEGGTVAVETPDIKIVYDGGTPQNTPVTLWLAASLDHDLTNASWSNSPPDQPSAHQFSWTLPVTRQPDADAKGRVGTAIAVIRSTEIKSMYLTGTIPQEEGSNASRTFLSGILVGVAAAAAIALVSEIRTRDGRVRAALAPIDPTTTTSAGNVVRRRSSVRSHRAGRLRRQR